MAAETPTLLLYRNALPARIAGTVLLVASIVMGLVFAELTLRTETLRCDSPVNGTATCALVESWPLVAPRETAMSPVVDARARADAGRRGTNVVLLLEHADRTVSELEGVGKLGERAETVALQLRDHLEGGAHATTFPLRPAVPAIAVALLLVFCVTPLLLLPGLYARLRVVGGATPSVHVGRGLLRARQLTFDGAPPEVAIDTRVVGGSTVYVLRVVGAERGLDVMATTNVEACRTLQATIRAAVAAPA